MKKTTKEFYYWLNIIEEDIEKARQEKLYSLALEYSAQAIGFTRLAYFMDIIEHNEYEKLHKKFYDYYYLYYDLVVYDFT